MRRPFHIAISMTLLIGIPSVFQSVLSFQCYLNVVVFFQMLSSLTEIHIFIFIICTWIAPLFTRLSPKSKCKCYSIQYIYICSCSYRTKWKWIQKYMYAGVQPSLHPIELSHKRNSSVWFCTVVDTVSIRTYLSINRMHTVIRSRGIFRTGKLFYHHLYNSYMHMK